MRVYLIGSLRNAEVPRIAARLRDAGHEVFDEWHAAGPEADDFMRDYLRARGDDYNAALRSLAVQHVFKFDKRHLDRSDVAVMVMPGGKSAHLELGYVVGSGGRGIILLDREPDRIDIMHAFAERVVFSVEELVDYLRQS